MGELALDDPDVDDLPPSHLYILEVLEREGPLTRQELIDRMYPVSESTVDRALSRLNGDFLVKTRENEDLRQVVVKLAGV